MWANDFRLSSHWSHFCALRPTLKEKLSTFLLCHATATGSATSPSILRDIRLTIAPYTPVSSALGMRVLPAISASGVSLAVRHGDTDRERRVTARARPL